MPARFSLVAIDCPDPVALARFYGGLTGLAVAPLEGPAESVEWVELDNHGAPTLAFQRVGALPAPTWPDGPQPQRLHLDLSVEDLDAGEAAALALGATRADHQPGTSFRVFYDPIGHPFCLVLAGASGD